MLCDAGHFDCLTYLVEHGCPVEDPLLGIALGRGHFPSVALLLRHGLPHNRPYLHTANGPWIGSNQLRCLQHLVDSGCPIHPGTLIRSANRGDVATVRLLHEGGVPLWERAWEWEAGDEADSDPPLILMAFALSVHAERHKLIVVRQKGVARTYMRKVLRYGACMGAPVTPAVEEMLRADRARTRAVLLSFHVAGRLSQGKESRKLRATWAVMARMPPDLIDKVLVRADLEIPESVGRSIPIQRCVRVQLRGPDELCNQGVTEYAIPSRSTK
jgi:hypothetical protein